MAQVIGTIAAIQDIVFQAARCHECPARPARWVVDPNEYLKPQVYDPEDDRWKKPDRDKRNTLGVCTPHDREHDKR